MDLTRAQAVAEFPEQSGGIPQHGQPVDQAQCMKVGARTALPGQAGVGEYPSKVRVSLHKQVESAVPVGGIQYVSLRVRHAESVHEGEDLFHELSAHAAEVAADNASLPPGQGLNAEVRLRRFQIAEVDHVPVPASHRLDDAGDRSFTRTSEKHVVLKDQQGLRASLECLTDSLPVTEQCAVGTLLSGCALWWAQGIEKAHVAWQRVQPQRCEFRFHRAAPVGALREVDDPYLVEELEYAFQCSPMAATLGCSPKLTTAVARVKGIRSACA